MVNRKNKDKLTLQRQLILIYLLFLAFVVFIVNPIITSNINLIVDNEMYDVLDNSQKNFDVYSSLVSSRTDKQIYHLTYNYKTQTILPVGNINNEDATAIYKTIKNDLDMMVDKNKSSYRNKTYFKYAEIYYQIDEKEPDIFKISFLFSDYSSSLVNSIQNRILYILYGALVLLGIVLLLWLVNIIKPLYKINRYIEELKNGEEANLEIKRNDVIGMVAKELVEMKESLDSQNQIKEEMIHNISHDLKTPISLINTYAQSLKDGVYPYGDMNKSLDVIIENSNRLGSKVKSLLYLNRLDYLSDKASDAKTDMKECISIVVNQLKLLNDKIEIYARYKDGVFFDGEEEHWRVCIENIIENDYRYAKSYISIILSEDCLEIHNDGSSIDDKLKESIFRPYERGVNGQFGLGLSIVQKIVSLYGYSIEVENKEDGVSFIIKKPAN